MYKLFSSVFVLGSVCRLVKSVMSALLIYDRLNVINLFFTKTHSGIQTVKVLSHTLVGICLHFCKLISWLLSNMIVTISGSQKGYKGRLIGCKTCLFGHKVEKIVVIPLSVDLVILYCNVVSLMIVIRSYDSSWKNRFPTLVSTRKLKEHKWKSLNESACAAYPKPFPQHGLQLEAFLLHQGKRQLLFVFVANLALLLTRDSFDGMLAQKQAGQNQICRISVWWTK